MIQVDSCSFFCVENKNKKKKKHNLILFCQDKQNAAEPKHDVEEVMDISGIVAVDDHIEDIDKVSLCKGSMIIFDAILFSKGQYINWEP